MQPYKKGALTRINIVENARTQFNEKGIGLTIEQLAKELGLIKSRITNHYPTKDSLFLAIIDEYEKKLAEYISAFQWNQSGPDFHHLKRLLLGVMDIQYAYRCSIAYSSAIMPTGNELAQRISATAKSNKENIKRRLKVMVEKGLLEKRLLKKAELDLFFAGYLNLLTTWVTTIELYQANLSLKSIQHQYMQAIMRCYLPYLTEQGRLNFTSAGLTL